MRKFHSRLAIVALLSLLPTATALGTVILKMTDTNNGTGAVSVGGARDPAQRIERIRQIIVGVAADQAITLKIVFEGGPLLDGAAPGVGD